MTMQTKPNQTVSYFETVLVLSCDFIYILFIVACLEKLFIGDWKRRHVDSEGHKEEGCKEKERGWQIW